jgi:shikimate dehydrogenase
VVKQIMRLLTGHAALAGVIGWPVGHSRSPRLHGTWLDRYGIDGAYLPLPVRPADIKAVLATLPQIGFVGVNVTIPHKEAAFAACDRIEDSARRAGAVNTLVFRGNMIIGANTDGAGFIANLRAHKADPAGPALVLGAGGAARAIGAALLDAGAPVIFCNRDPDRAQTLAKALPPAKVIAWSQRHAALADIALVVNATSLGMTGYPPLDLSLDHAQSALIVADIVYVPLETPLLAEARARGLRAVEGLGMLLHQAVPGFAAWFGTTPVVDEALYSIVAGDLVAPGMK